MVRAKAGELEIDGQFAYEGQLALTLDSEPAAFVRRVEYATRGGFAAAARVDSTWRVPCTGTCRVRYHFSLREACESLAQADTAIAAGDAWIAPASTWLLHPDAAGPGTRFELQVQLTEGERFVTALHPSVDGVPNSYEAAADVLDDATYAAFGALRVSEVAAGDTTLELAIAPHGLDLSAEQSEAWLRTAAGAVASYYRGHLPARHTLVLLMRGSGTDTRGLTLGGGGPAVLIRASDRANSGATADDWVLTHELLHANFPDLGRAHSWLSEGLATYIEPIARARVGLVSEAKVWRDMLEGMPQGLPQAGDQGLERTRTWGRTYWGGALFCLLADLTLRERTGNQRSLDDVLLAIGKTGASDQDRWTIQQVLEMAFRATGTRVVEELYQELAEKPGSVDLARLFARLGVRKAGDTVVFDDTAELATIRKSITAQNP